MLAVQASAETSRTYTAVSPAKRVVMLELYTSEGCSSCPPADRFISRLKHRSLDDQLLIPLSFHVTYWDYIGWRDPYAPPAHGNRQSWYARQRNLRTVYHAAV